MKWQGAKIRELSKAKGISFQNLAELVGVSRQAVNDWANGQVPKGNHLVSLCKIFQVNPDLFFSDKTDDRITLPIHRTRQSAKVTSEMQNEAMLLSKKYVNFFANQKDPEVVPIIKVSEKSLENARIIAKTLRDMAGTVEDKPIDYEHTFRLAERLGIKLIFRDFPNSIKGYAFYVKILSHRIVLVNNSTNVIDLIFPLLHEFVHAIRDDITHSSVYEKEEDNFCDAVANFIQFPDVYVREVYKTIKDLKPGIQIRILKNFASSNGYSLFGIVKAIKRFAPEFNLDVGGANTNLKRDFPTVGEILFKGKDAREYVHIIKDFSKIFVSNIYGQIDYVSDRKIAELLGIESVLDAKEVKAEIKKAFAESES
jgi:transcriptional regulator with XRE-family HTH domain